LPFTLVFAMGLIVIAALLSAYTWLPELSKHLPAESLAPLDLAADHNLAVWFASLFLVSNMQLALLVYSVRKHRVDDYHGRYRVWLAMAAASLVASVDLATGVSRLLKVALAPAARWCGVAEHYGLWTVLGVLGVYLSVRLVLETRRSSLALVTFLFAAISLAVPLTMSDRMFTFNLPLHATMFRVGLHLLGCLLLLAGTMLFARHVMLDVEGKLPERKARKLKPAKAKKAKTVRPVASDDLESVRTMKLNADPPQKPKLHVGVRTDLDSRPKAPLTPKPTFVPSKPAPPIAARDDDDDDEEDEDKPTDLRNLSRAERKRLKREAKLARRAEAA
jgi:hypothetical protein